MKANNLIIKGLRSEVAFRYYSKTAPKRKYTRTQARKQFMQDNNVDMVSVALILSEIFEKQKKALLISN